MTEEFLANAWEAHECHSEETCYDEGGWHAFDAFREFGEGELLADACKEDEGESEACWCGEGKYYALEQVHIFLDYHDCNTEDGTVGGDEWKEHAKRLIERRGNLFEDDFDHLHEGGNHKDVRYGL